MELLNGLLGQLNLAIQYRREYARVLGELESYRSNELHDLRLDRADFHHVAQKAAEEHVARLAQARPAYRVGGLRTA